MIRLLAILLIVVGVFWVFRRLLRSGQVSSGSDERPPLVIDPDDPLMIEATAKARASLDDFRRLVAGENRGARVKVPFRTDSGADEQVWAEVIAIIGSEVEVRIESRPVSQQGPLHEIQRYPLSDLIDWQVELPDGRLAGGHTMRAMFRKGREQWGRLPSSLEAEERRYR